MGYHEAHRNVHDDNFIDRLSHYYTIMFLLFMNVFVVTEEYVGEPIQCFCPADFTDAEVAFTNYVCWVSNTYYIPFSQQIPEKYDDRRIQEIAYYQWVPLIMFLMAAMFKFPRVVWKYMSLRSGLSLKKILDMAKDLQTAPPEERELRLRYIAKYLDAWVRNVNKHRAGMFSGVRTRVSQICSLGCGRHYGNYLVTLNIFVRLLFFINVGGQLFFLNEFLGNKFYIFGYEMIYSYFKGIEWEGSPRFPRVTLCDFDLRQLNNVQRWTLQCVLPVNLYNEAFFITLWFWYTIVTFLSLMNVLFTILGAILPYPRQSFVKKYLKMNNLYTDGGKDPRLRRNVDKFIHWYLKHDGVYVLKSLSSTSNTVIVADLVNYLWGLFREREIHAESNGSLTHAPDKDIRRFHPTNRRDMRVSWGSSHSVSHLSDESSKRFLADNESYV